MNDVSYYLPRSLISGVQQNGMVGTPNIINGDIPAKDRYAAGNYTYCQKPPAQQTVIIAANEKSNNDNYSSAENEMIVHGK